MAEYIKPICQKMNYLRSILMRPGVRSNATVTMNFASGPSRFDTMYILQVFNRIKAHLACIIV